MKPRYLATFVVTAITLGACSDQRFTPTAPLAPPAASLAAPATRLSDETAPSAVDQQIDALIDQIYRSRRQRAFVHAEWDWVEQQLATCPPSQTALEIQAYFSRVVAFMGESAPTSDAASYALFKTLIDDMQSYVNNAVSSCSTVYAF